MGIYDRDYYRDEQRAFGFGPGTERSMVVILILVNVAVYVLDMLTDQWLINQMAVSAGTLWHPLEWWKFLTAAFAHDPSDLSHIFFNMLGLFIFGRGVEQVYGRYEFLRIYLVTAVFASVVWCAIDWFTYGVPNHFMFGASGVISGITILFALNFRNVTILFMFVLPMPAWVFAILFVLYDLFSAFSGSGVFGAENVAYTAHLAGAAFGFIYYQSGWNFGRLISRFVSPDLFRRRPRLKVHEPREQEERPLQERVDAILEKISREGESSLTREERNTLEEASRRYQRRRQ